MICEFGDVVVVPFPFVEEKADKRRPSAILSGKKFNQANGHSVCLMITTAARAHWPTDIPISDLKAAGLSRPCVVRWKIFTLPNDLILRRAGTLTVNDRNRVVAAAKAVMS